MTPFLFPPKPSRRSITIATIVSVAAHLAIFAIPMQDRIRADILRGSGGAPLSVVLVSPPPATQVEPPAPPTPAVPTPAPRPPRGPRPITKEVAKAPLQLPPPEPAPAPTPTPSREPPVDMLAMLNAARERRRAAAAREGLERSTEEPTPDQVAAASINRNLQTLRRGEGTSGVFQILRKGHRTAEFAFNGFRTERKWREVIEVDAGVGGDVDLAIIRRMIELIRGHYSGNFNWESHRLGRTVVLSARPEDQAGLEAFLMREFFGPPTLGSAR